MSSWPNIVCIMRKFAPPANKCDANECRRTCGDTRVGSIPDKTAHFFKILKNASRVMWPDFEFVGKIYFESLSPRICSHL